MRPRPAEHEILGETAVYPGHAVTLAYLIVKLAQSASPHAMAFSHERVPSAKYSSIWTAWLFWPPAPGQRGWVDPYQKESST